MNSKILPVQTKLYHGTCGTNSFEFPRAPAWFAFTVEQALYWAGPVWNKSVQPVARIYETKFDIGLLDLRDREALIDLSEWLDWYDEEDTRGMAQALVDRGSSGWYGNNEVMLVCPDMSLVYRGETHSAWPHSLPTI
jgi:hypothetical protein